MVELLPLQLLSPGQTARIAHLSGTGEAIHRLQEIGLRQGAEVEVVQPGSPCIVKIDGHRLAVRLDHGVGVFVEQVRVEGAVA